MNKLLYAGILSFLLLSCDTLEKKGPQPWPKGHVPFNLIGFNIEESLQIYQCMEAWEFASNRRIKFHHVRRDKDIKQDTKTLKIIKLNLSERVLGAGFNEGYDPDNIQVILLGNLEDRTILHELGHSLGLIHEHQRPDRDQYIKVNWEVLTEEEKLQFIIIEPNLYKWQHFPYDYDSIMHYDSYYIDANGHEIGKKEISVIDALKLQEIYKDTDFNI